VNQGIITKEIYKKKFTKRNLQKEIYKKKFTKRNGDYPLRHNRRHPELVEG
jgi:hypothetical protein